MNRRTLDNAKAHTDLFAVMYGCLVVQMMEDLDDLDLVNEELLRIGYDMGQRIADDYFSKTNTRRCENMPALANALVTKAFPMYLNCVASVGNWSNDGTEFSISFEKIQIMDYAELPESCVDLKFLNILCGAIKGALNMVQLTVKVEIVQDMLKGDAKNELRIKYIHRSKDEVPPGE